MLIQCRTDLLISHSRILLVLLLIVHLEPSTKQRIHENICLIENSCAASRHNSFHAECLSAAYAGILYIIE
jgi:hypothetical protein